MQKEVEEGTQLHFFVGNWLDCLRFSWIGGGGEKCFIMPLLIVGGFNMFVNKLIHPVSWVAGKELVLAFSLLLGKLSTIILVICVKVIFGRRAPIER